MHRIQRRGAIGVQFDVDALRLPAVRHARQDRVAAVRRNRSLVRAPIPSCRDPILQPDQGTAQIGNRIPAQVADQDRFDVAGRQDKPRGGPITDAVSVGREMELAGKRAPALRRERNRGFVVGFPMLALEVFRIDEHREQADLGNLAERPGPLQLESGSRLQPRDGPGRQHFGAARRPVLEEAGLHGLGRLFTDVRHLHGGAHLGPIDRRAWFEPDASGLHRQIAQSPGDGLAQADVVVLVPLGDFRLAVGQHEQGGIPPGGVVGHVELDCGRAASGQAILETGCGQAHAPGPRIAEIQRHVEGLGVALAQVPDRCEHGERPSLARRGGIELDRPELHDEVRLIAAADLDGPLCRVVGRVEFDDRVVRVCDQPQPMLPAAVGPPQEFALARRTRRNHERDPLQARPLPGDLAFEYHIRRGRIRRAVVADADADAQVIAVDGMLGRDHDVLRTNFKVNAIPVRNIQGERVVGFAEFDDRIVGIGNQLQLMGGQFGDLEAQREWRHPARHHRDGRSLQFHPLFAVAAIKGKRERGNGLIAQVAYHAGHCDALAKMGHLRCRNTDVRGIQRRIDARVCGPHRDSQFGVVVVLACLDHGIVHVDRRHQRRDARDVRSLDRHRGDERLSGKQGRNRVRRAHGRAAGTRARIAEPLHGRGRDGLATVVAHADAQDHGLAQHGLGRVRSEFGERVVGLRLQRKAQQRGRSGVHAAAPVAVGALARQESRQEIGAQFERQLQDAGVPKQLRGVTDRRSDSCPESLQEPSPGPASRGLVIRGRSPQQGTRGERGNACARHATDGVAEPSLCALHQRQETQEPVAGGRIKQPAIQTGADGQRRIEHRGLPSGQHPDPVGPARLEKREIFGQGNHRVFEQAPGGIVRMARVPLPQPCTAGTDRRVIRGHLGQCRQSHRGIAHRGSGPVLPVPVHPLAGGKPGNPRAQWIGSRLDRGTDQGHRRGDRGLGYRPQPADRHAGTPGRDRLEVGLECMPETLQLDENGRVHRFSRSREQDKRCIKSPLRPIGIGNPLAFGIDHPLDRDGLQCAAGFHADDRHGGRIER